jgi:DNA-binding CsgD family transcriptional regulator
LGWLALDEIDYGIVVVDREGGVLHANRRARTELKAGDHALVFAEGRLRARCSRDIPQLAEALDAVGRGLRRLIEMDRSGERVNVALMPLSASTGEGPMAALVVIGRRHLCENLSVQSFARANDLTLAETRVLEALCAGETAAAMACRQGVAVSTVRTHIASIRMKTGTRSLQELVRRVAALPPLVSALRVAS